MPLRPCRLSIRTKTASCLRRSTVPWGAVPAAVVEEKVIVRKGAVLKQVDPVEAKRADLVVRDVAPVADRAVGRVVLVAVEVGKAVPAAVVPVDEVQVVKVVVPAVARE